MNTHAVDVNRTKRSISQRISNRPIRAKNSPAFNLLRNPQGPCKVLGEDRSGETVLGVIGDPHRLLLALDWDQADTRAKALRPVQLHLLLHALHNNRAQPRLRDLARLGVLLLALVVAVHDLGALGHGILDELPVLLDGRALHEHGRGARVELLEEALQRGAELLDDVLVHEDALGRHADLAAVEEGAQGCLHGSHLDVRVIEHDGARLAAELHQAWLQRLAGRRGDDGADAGAAGEVDLADHGRVDQLVGDGRRILAGGVQDVHDAGGQAGVGENAGDIVVAARAEFGALEDGRVAGGNGVQDGPNAQDVRSIPAAQQLASCARFSQLPLFVDMADHDVIPRRTENSPTRAQWQEPRQMAP